MGIKLEHDGISGFKKLLMERMDRAIITKLQMLGEELVAYARNNHTYTDQTGNLTNSMGYAVVRNKEVVFFGGSTQSGVSVDSALKTVNDILNETQSSYSLIIVAGMNYAAYVEAKGYNVILPAELKAKKDFPAAMSRIIEKVLSKISSKEQ